MERFEPKYKLEIQQVTYTGKASIYLNFLTIGQMMYVAGETQDPSPDTLTLVEDIIRDQVILMVPSLSTFLLAVAGHRNNPRVS